MNANHDLSHLKIVNHNTMKLDALALVTGKPVYTDDLAPSNCLIVKCLRSPHAFAKITAIKTDIALKVPGIACIFTYQEVPPIRFTTAANPIPSLALMIA